MLATIGRRWRLDLDPRQKIALNPIITLRPKYGMRMTLTKLASEPPAILDAAL